MVFLLFCQAGSSTCSLLRTLLRPCLSAGCRRLLALHHQATRFSQWRNSARFALTQYSWLRQMCWRILGKSLRHFENFRTEDTSSAELLPRSCSSLLFFFKVPLMSVWREPQACELVSHLCSIRASACPAPASVSICALEGTVASGRIPLGWSCRRGHSQSSDLARAGDVPGHVLCKCPASTPAFLTGWWRF